MLHKAWNSKGEMPYCFPRSSIKFQGHTALKIVEFDPNWAFPDCNPSLNSPMAMKCCTKLETAKERCPIVFQGHPSNFKVTRDKTSPILTQIGRFRTIGRSQLSNPSDLPCLCIVRIKLTRTFCEIALRTPQNTFENVTIGSGNGLVSSGNKPLHKPLLTQIHMPYGSNIAQWVNSTSTESQ